MALNKPFFMCFSLRQYYYTLKLYFEGNVDDIVYNGKAPLF